MCGRDGAVNVVYGPARVPLEAFCVWGAADNAIWDALRAERLDTAASDHELSTEVLAALLCGKSSFIERYALEKLARPEPAAIARGLMVLGFGEPSEFASDTIAKYEEVEGFLGNAAEQARYAYERAKFGHAIGTGSCPRRTLLRNFGDGASCFVRSWMDASRSGRRMTCEGAKQASSRPPSTWRSRSASRAGSHIGRRSFWATRHLPACFCPARSPIVGSHLGPTMRFQENQ